MAVPRLLLAAGAASAVGYFIAVHLVGRAVWVATDLLPPDNVAERAGVALAGALVVSLLGLLPILGWGVLFVLTLTGVGALAVAWFRPEFGGDPA